MRFTNLIHTHKVLGTFPTDPVKCLKCDGMAHFNSQWLTRGEFDLSDPIYFLLEYYRCDKDDSHVFEKFLKMIELDSDELAYIKDCERKNDES